MLDSELKLGGWSLLYYDTLKLIGKYKIKGNKKVNPKTMEEKDVFVNINYAEACLLNIIIQLGNIKDNTSCTMKNSNLSEIMNAEERQVQLYLHNLKQIGVIYSHEDRLKGNKCITTKRTIYVDYAKIRELSTCEKSHVVETQPHVKLGTKDMLKTVPSTCEISHPNNDNNNDIYNDSYTGVKINMSDIKISRRKDLEYILDLYETTEEDIIKIIYDNNIDDCDDFVHLLHYETEDINLRYGRKILNIQDVVSNYHKFHNYNKFQKGDNFKITDVLEYISKEQSNKVFNYFFEMFSSTTDIKSDLQVEGLYKMISEGAKISTHYFVRNSKRHQ